MEMEWRWSSNQEGRLDPVFVRERLTYLRNPVGNAVKAKETEMEIKKILVPIADPERPGPAARLSVAMAKPLDATVTLLHVIEGEEPDDSDDSLEQSADQTGDLAPGPDAETASAHLTSDSGDSDEVRIQHDPNEAVALAERQMIESSETLRSKGVPVTVMVAEGDPVERIQATAHVAGFDLVAMEGIRTSRLAKMLFGSTADAVKRETNLPVLIVQPDEQTRPRLGEAPDAVIVPLDMEPDSEHVIAPAEDLAKQLGTEIRFVHAVLDRVAVAHPAAPLGASMAIVDDGHVADAEEYLEQFTSRARSHGLEAFATVESGAAINVLSRTAAKFENPVIVTDSSERSGLLRLVLGSLPEDLTLDTGNPVMVLPKPLGPVID